MLQTVREIERKKVFKFELQLNVQKLFLFESVYHGIKVSFSGLRQKKLL